MKKMRYLMIIGFVVNQMICRAQSDYCEVEKQYRIVVSECAVKHFEDKLDDLSILLKPLNELKLDKHYILSDFRKTYSQSLKDYAKGLAPRDDSILRLYARKKSVKRPDKDYFDDEFEKYSSIMEEYENDTYFCQTENAKYKKVQGHTPFISPFEKIRLSGSDMSFWQAYLLFVSPKQFGMRGIMGYSFENLIICSDDVNRIMLNLAKFEEVELDFKVDTIKTNGQQRKHLMEVRTVLDSLNVLKSMDLNPVFTHQGDTVYLEHYAYSEFGGLFRKRIMVIYDKRKHKIKKIGEMAKRKIAHYYNNRVRYI